MGLIAFSIWMVGWPWLCSYSRINRHTAGIVDATNVVQVTAFVEFITWILVAILIWSKI